METNLIIQISVVCAVAFFIFRRKDQIDRHNYEMRQQYGNNYSEGSKFPGVIYLIIAGVAYVLYQKVKTGGM